MHSALREKETSQEKNDMLMKINEMLDGKETSTHTRNTMVGIEGMQGPNESESIIRKDTQEQNLKEPLTDNDKNQNDQEEVEMEGEDNSEDERNSIYDKEIN